MNRFAALMSRRVAGIPVGIIAVIVAAGILVIALRMKGTPAATEDETSDEPSPDGDVGGEVSNPVFEASPSTPSVVATPEPLTNELWAKKAREWLMANGLSPSAAQTLVAKYLNSEALTEQDKQNIDRVITAIGYPPEPPDITDVVTDPDTTDDTTSDNTVPDSGGGSSGGSGGSDNAPPSRQGVPPCHHVIKNSRDNGPGELSLLYYGSNAPAKVARLEAANWEYGPGPWSVGTKVKIPDDHPPVYFTATATVRGLNEIAAKNGVSKEFIKALNPGMNFPVAKGTRVRVN